MASYRRQIFQLLRYHVPAYANGILYMFGGISAMALLILIASGIFLAQFYSPTPDAAHSSIVNYVTTVPFADFWRSLHFWAANLIVILLILHISRVYITGAYKKPRRLTWYTGIGLLAIVVAYIFIGTVLKWDQEGVEALGHMRESFELFGIHIGLTNNGIPIITQLYSWHTTVLTLLLLGLLGTHMLLIKLRGISSKPTRKAVAKATAGHGSSTFIVHLRRLSGFGLLFLTVAGLLAIVFPAPIGHPGILDQEVTKPLWMYWPFFGLEDIFGLKGLVWGMVGFFAFLAIVPLIDRNPHAHWSYRKLVLVLGAIFVAATIGLGVYSRVHPPKAHLEEDMPKTTMTQMASADNLSVSHHKLRTEAYYLVPALAVIGVFGVRLSRPEKH